jgi:hypothetical protein
MTATAKKTAPAAKVEKTTANGRQTVQRITGTIKLIAAKCPSAAGTVRAKRWASLKSGMTVAEAGEKKVPVTFLRRMEKAGHLKIT